MTFFSHFTNGLLAFLRVNEHTTCALGKMSSCALKRKGLKAEEYSFAILFDAVNNIFDVYATCIPR